MKTKDVTDGMIVDWDGRVMVVNDTITREMTFVDGERDMVVLRGNISHDGVEYAGRWLLDPEKELDVLSQA